VKCDLQVAAPVEETENIFATLNDTVESQKAPATQEALVS